MILWPKVFRFALYGGQSGVPSKLAKLLRSLLSILAQEKRDGWHDCRLADELEIYKMLVR